MLSWRWVGWSGVGDDDEITKRLTRLIRLTRLMRLTRLTTMMTTKEHS